MAGPAEVFADMHEYASEFCQLSKSIKKITHRFYLLKQAILEAISSHMSRPASSMEEPDTPVVPVFVSPILLCVVKVPGHHFRSVCFRSSSVRGVCSCLSSTE